MFLRQIKKYSLISYNSLFVRVCMSLECVCFGTYAFYILTLSLISDQIGKHEPFGRYSKMMRIVITNHYSC